ncbi:hypothetical protein [Niveispirillum sp.]|nr:hypothetical protein [Niveispirillum sp.]MBP7336617.1 hypothetical protein [Niveispirillum sp.]
MTDLTNHNEANEGLLSSFLASLPTAADVIEATTALAVGALLTLSLHMML